MSCALEISHGTARIGRLTYASEECAYLAETEHPPIAAPSLLALQYARSTNGAMPPFLEVSLPEGYMRRAMLARLAGRGEPSDFALLRAAGGNMIGLVRAANSQAVAPRANDGLQLNVAQALYMEEGALLELVYGPGKAWPGVSGGFMKLFVTSPARSPLERNRHWIVKLADRDRPGLCAVEHFGMCAARSMGLAVPETIVSNNYSRYMVERFDIDSSGDQLGFVDMCAISGAPAADKYSSSAERIAGMLGAACDPAAAASSQDAFFAQYFLASVIRNGDAHLKNFGLLYGDGRLAAIAPVYDMLSMAVYAPKRNDGDAADGMALTLNGTRRWPSPAMLDGLASRCGVSRDRQIWWQERLQSALAQAGLCAVKAAGQNDIGRASRAVIERMLELWSIGIRPYSRQGAKDLEEMARGMRA